ncbi:hypothetical protein FGO68_gene11686 [Halteria grandinella]|uniref:Protein kinase domain-containing protein n=1 Tax=Halteria grandinella TaxID=5974 RepID=A0A8J8P512_HALGN|nr:hypothetical protein FGO68_gene11686 [Halteria grandinella]
MQRSTFSHTNSHAQEITGGINIANLKSTFRNSQVYNQGSQYDHSWRIPSTMFVAGNSPNQDTQLSQFRQSEKNQTQKNFNIQWLKPSHQGQPTSPKAKQPLVVDSFGGQTTIPIFTADSSHSHQNTWQGNGAPVKMIRVYVDKDIEFNIPIPAASDQLTCGWLLSEVTRRYIEALTRIKIQGSGQIQKYTRKMIVALKTTDQRESLDYWLTQYDRTLEVLQDGDFLIAHFAKLRETRGPSIDAHNLAAPICKEDFEQIKVIGRGGFSRVVLARKKDTGRLYAVKIMKKARIVREKKLKPILSERSILEMLSVKHPFIIKLHWAFQSRDELFFVMDVCTGGELFYHLSKHKRLSTVERRYSYYYESTLQSKRSMAAGEQYNQFFANESIGSNKHAASIQSDTSNQENAIENFTFIDVPREELEVLRTLKHKTQHQRMMVINPDQIQRRREKSRAANQQDQEILIAEEVMSRNHVIVNATANGPAILQTVSNGSIITFYDESNQSIAQEFMINDGVAMVLPTGQPQTVGAILEVTNDDQLFEKYDEMFPPVQQQRLTIEEVDEDSLKQGGGDTLRSDLSESQKYTEEITKNVSPVQVEKQIVIGNAINFKDNMLFQTLKSPVNMELLAQSAKASNNPLSLMMSSTFQMRTPSNFKASSTIVSPKLSLTAQTPSKDTLVKKSGAFITAVSSTNQTGRKANNTEIKQKSIITQQTQQQQQSISVRESFTKDKHIFSSENSSEHQKIDQHQRTHFYYKHAQQSSSSPRKPVSTLTKKKIPLHTTGSTARVQAKPVYGKQGLPTSHYKAPLQKSTVKSFLKQGVTKNNEEEAFPQVPTTTENNQDDDEYVGSAVKVKDYLNIESQEQQRAMKFNMVPYKSPGQKSTSIQQAYHSVKGNNPVVGQQQQQSFQTFQRLLFQGGTGIRSQMQGSDMSIGDNEHGSSTLQNPQLILNNPAKLYQSINHLGMSMTTNKKIHLDQSSKLALADESANKSSLVIGNHQQQHMSPGSQQSHNLQRRGFFESSFDKSKQGKQAQETHEYLIGSIPHTLQSQVIPQFQATQQKQNVKVQSHQKPAYLRGGGVSSNVFQTPKSSLSSKLFIANATNTQQKPTAAIIGTPNNQSMIGTQQTGSANGRRRQLLGNTQSQLNINVINSGNNGLINNEGQQRKGRDQSTRYSKMSRNAGNSMKANTAKAISSSRIQ